MKIGNRNNPMFGDEGETPKEPIPPIAQSHPIMDAEAANAAASAIDNAINEMIAKHLKGGPTEEQEPKECDLCGSVCYAYEWVCHECNGYRFKKINLISNSLDPPVF